MPSAKQQIRFCTTPDGVRIAYATSGGGPPLVKVANWMTHLEFDWESPVWRHWLTNLSHDHTYVRYDARGCGLSDWDAPELSFEAWVRDLETVVDAVGVQHFPLLGLSQGGPIAIAYAVRHPERPALAITEARRYSSRCWRSLRRRTTGPVYPAPCCSGPRSFSRVRWVPSWAIFSTSPSKLEGWH